ncbi:hypothetical protein ACTPEF_25710, partial [Clostridioides difficile]
PGHEKYLELSILPEGEISKSGLDKLKSDYGSSIDIMNEQNKIGHSSVHIEKVAKAILEIIQPNKYSILILTLENNTPIKGDAIA